MAGSHESHSGPVRWPDPDQRDLRADDRRAGSSSNPLLPWLLLLAYPFLLLLHAAQTRNQRLLLAAGALSLVLVVSVVLAAARPVAPPAPVSTPIPSATRSAPAAAFQQPTPSPTPTPTVVPARLKVANTGGDGVFLRTEPRPNASYVRAWSDGTIMIVAGPDTETDGRTWKQVRDPTGTVGYVPAQYLAPE